MSGIPWLTIDILLAVFILSEILRPRPKKQSRLEERQRYEGQELDEANPYRHR